METREVPVLVVGGGPAGLTIAVTLARYGIECLLVERRQTPSSHPRATTTSTRTMELVRSWGLEEEVLAGGVDVDWLMWQCETLAEAADGVGLHVGLPTREQSALISPTAPGCVPQDHLESVMFSHLRSLGPARVELGTTLERIESRPDGVRAIVSGSDGEPREVRARYLVAADGAYSTVRDQLGVRMHGSQDILGAATSLFRAPLWSLLTEHRYGIYSIGLAEAEGVFLPAGPGDRWGYGFFVPPGDGARAEPSPEQMSERIRRAAGVADLPLRLERLGSFSSAAQLAEHFRHGDVFLVGDAAHRVTPRGGTGMNTAIQDGHDLGWKLGWVLRGWAHPDLLDSYERERRPVAEHNVARSADPDGSIRDAEDELHVDLAGRIPHVWLSTPSGRMSTLDLLGPGLTLFVGPDAQGWRCAAEGLTTTLPLAVHTLDDITARALGVRRGGGLLARADGLQVASWSDSTDAGYALHAAIAAASASPRAPRPQAEEAIREAA
jgi:putative polyketide hydroxylase